MRTQSKEVQACSNVSFAFEDLLIFRLNGKWNVPTTFGCIDGQPGSLIHSRRRGSSELR